MALTGRLDVDFTREPIVTVDGREIRIAAPTSDELPRWGFDAGESGFLAPAVDGSLVIVAVSPDSDRLELLEPFPA